MVSSKNLSDRWPRVGSFFYTIIRLTDLSSEEFEYRAVDTSGCWAWTRSAEDVPASGEVKDHMRFVCILANARTGSSHLTRLLHSCAGINMKSEIFHRRLRGLVSNAEMDALYRKSGGAIVDTPTLCHWRGMNPGRTLETLYELGGYVPVIFKLFPGHVSNQLVADEIFSRRDVAYIYLRRRPIESFISSVKAKVVSFHGEADTTEIKPNLTVEDFLKWARPMRAWHDWLETEIAWRRLSPLRIGYESDLESNRPEEVLEKVLTGLQALGVTRVKPKTRIFVGTRQDREEHYRNRVANWAKFEAVARERPRAARFLDWAEAIP